MRVYRGPSYNSGINQIHSRSQSPQMGYLMNSSYKSPNNLYSQQSNRQPLQFYNNSSQQNIHSNQKMIKQQQNSSGILQIPQQNQSIGYLTERNMNVNKYQIPPQKYNMISSQTQKNINSTQISFNPKTQNQVKTSKQSSDKENCYQTQKSTNNLFKSELQNKTQQSKPNDADKYKENKIIMNAYQIPLPQAKNETYLNLDVSQGISSALINTKNDNQTDKTETLYKINQIEKSLAKYDDNQKSEKSTLQNSDKSPTRTGYERLETQITQTIEKSQLLSQPDIPKKYTKNNFFESPPLVPYLQEFSSNQRFYDQNFGAQKSTKPNEKQQSKDSLQKFENPQPTTNEDDNLNQLYYNVDNYIQDFGKQKDQTKFNDHLEEIRVGRYLKEIQDLQHQLQQAQQENTQLELQQNQELQAQEIKRLKEKIQNLQKQNEQYLNLELQLQQKIARIQTLENENNYLKNKISLLEKKQKKYQDDKKYLDQNYQNLQNDQNEEINRLQGILQEQVQMIQEQRQQIEELESQYKSFISEKVKNQGSDDTQNLEIENLNLKMDEMRSEFENQIQNNQKQILTITNERDLWKKKFSMVKEVFKNYTHLSTALQAIDLNK